MSWFGFNGLGAATSTQVKTAQKEINAQLVARGFEPIKVDGIVGPKTCGAARATSHPILAEISCPKFTDPTLSAAGPVVPAPGPNQPAAPIAPAIGPAPASTSAGMFGMDSKTVLIGAGVLAGGVVLVYFLKKKSQKAA